MKRSTLSAAEFEQQKKEVDRLTSEGYQVAEFPSDTPEPLNRYDVSVLARRLNELVVVEVREYNHFGINGREDLRGISQAVKQLGGRVDFVAVGAA